MAGKCMCHNLTGDHTTCDLCTRRKEEAACTRCHHQPDGDGDATRVCMFTPGLVAYMYLGNEVEELRQRLEDTLGAFEAYIGGERRSRKAEAAVNEFAAERRKRECRP